MSNLTVLAIALLFGFYWSSPGMSRDADEFEKRARAEATIVTVLRERGANAEKLPPNNLLAVGPLVLEYKPASRTIYAGVLVTEFVAWTAFPEYQPAILDTLNALHDERIGKMFDSGGADWTFDRKTGNLFLGFTHPVDEKPDRILASIEAIEELYPAWSLDWLPAIGEMVHQGAPLPSAPVTLENNPYR